jgi:hypothetical protein
VRSATRRSSSSRSSRPRSSCASISWKAARSFGGISRITSSMTLALEDDALLVCHLIAEFRCDIELMLSRTRVGIRPSGGSGIFAQKNNRECSAAKLRAVAFSAGGNSSPELLAQFYIRDFWFRLSQCHCGVLYRTLNTNWEEKLSITIRKTRRCHTPTWRRAQNAVCLNGVGHDGDSPNAGGSDAFRVVGPNGEMKMLDKAQQSDRASNANDKPESCYCSALPKGSGPCLPCYTRWLLAGARKQCASHLGQPAIAEQSRFMSTRRGW